MRKTSGISLILLIFLSLCLITFSLLSLSEASADEKLCRESADRTVEYYAACSTANHTLAEIDELLAEYLRKAASASSNDDSSLQLNEEKNEETTYLELCAALPESISDITWIHEPEESSGTVSYTVPVNDSQVLQVELSVSYPMVETDPLYTVTVWKVVNTRQWQADTSQNLLRTGESDTEFTP